MLIRILDESDANLYQQVRLAALKINPEAFGSTYERELQFPIETVMERLKPSNDKFVLGAFDGSALVGMVTFMRESGIKTQHKGNVFGMYVAPVNRGKKIGKQLLEALINKAKECDGLEQINLMVVSHNMTAKNLYQSVGFKLYGIEPKALKYKGEYFDEDLMVKML